MKLLLLPILCSLFLTQCATTSGSGFDPNKAITVVDVTVPSAVRLGVSKEPKAEKYLLAVAASIELLSGDEDLSIGALTEVVEATGINELKTPEARAIVGTVYALYKSYYSDVVKQNLDKSNLRLLLQAISTNIRLGLRK